MAELSYNDKQEAIRAALRKAGQDAYVADLFDTYVVYQTIGDETDSGKTFRRDYTISDAGAVTLGEEATEVQRKTVFADVKAVKFEDDSDHVIRGLAIPFGGPFAGKDIHGEDFGPDTDLCLDWMPHGRPILFHHGLDGAVKTAVVGRQTEVEIDDEGVWVKAQLDKRSRYYSRVAALVEKAALGFSSGAMPHLVKTRKDGHIERWPWVELSLTPTEANPNGIVYAVKADYDYFSSDHEDLAPGNGAYADHGSRVLTDVSQFLERTDDRAEIRGKAGRALSAANVEALRNLDGHLAGWEKDLAKKRERIADLLTQTDPDAKKAMDDLETELLITDLRIAGLSV